MSEAQLRRHGLEFALGSLPTANKEVDLAVEMVFPRTLINLRGNAENTEFCKAVRKILGQGLPKAANTFSRGRHHVYWLGPDEWLIAGSPEYLSDLLPELQADLGQWPSSVTEVSGGLVCLRLFGKYSREVLAKGCTLDLHANRFGVGDCSQCGLAKTSVLLALADAPPGFEIYVRRSFAEYLALWLGQAGREYGISFNEGSDIL